MTTETRPLIATAVGMVAAMPVYIPLLDAAGNPIASGGGGGGAGGDGATEPTLQEVLAMLTLVKAGIDTLNTEVGDTNPVATVGATASGVALTDPPLAMGLRASTTNPTAVADGQAVLARGTKDGRVINVPNAPRELKDSGQVTLTATTTPTDVLTAAGANVFGDLLSITLANSSATGTLVEVADEDGNAKWTGYAPPNGQGGIVFSAGPWNAFAPNKKWQAKTLTAVSSVVVTVQRAKDK